jgi:hypothetical protein
MEVSCQLHALTAVTPVKFATRHWIGPSVGHRAGPDATEKINTLISPPGIERRFFSLRTRSPVTVLSEKLEH